MRATQIRVERNGYAFENGPDGYKVVVAGEDVIHLDRDRANRLAHNLRCALRGYTKKERA